MSRDPRVDEYIAKAQPFARSVLKHLRKVARAGCPGVEETMKWSFPHFQNHGRMDGRGKNPQLEVRDEVNG